MGQVCTVLFARYDQELSELYRNMDSSDTARPNVEAIKGNIQQTIHSMEMSYGTTGSLFRSGSRQTFFATQVTRYAWGRVCNCILEFTN